jgi:hypothetical protein
MIDANKVKHYLTTLFEMFTARNNEDEVLETALLDELDVIWNSLQLSEKQEANRLSIGISRIMEN